MMIIEKNKQAPRELLDLFLAGPQIERAFCSTDNGGFDVFIILKNITKRELKEIEGDLSVIFQDYELPMLILKYKNMSFDLALQGKLPDGNAMRIITVEMKEHIIKHSRLLGLSEELTTNIRKGMKFTEGMSAKDILYNLRNKIFPKYSPKDMCKGGVRQRFEKNKQK